MKGQTPNPRPFSLLAGSVFVRDKAAHSASAAPTAERRKAACARFFAVFACAAFFLRERGRTPGHESEQEDGRFVCAGAWSLRGGGKAARARRATSSSRDTTRRARPVVMCSRRLSRTLGRGSAKSPSCTRHALCVACHGEASSPTAGCRFQRGPNLGLRTRSRPREISPQAPSLDQRRTAITRARPHPWLSCATGVCSDSTSLSCPQKTSASRRPSGAFGKP